MKNISSSTISLISIAVILYQCTITIAQPVENKTQILVLGTEHLNKMKNFEQNMLDNLMLKLDSFEFDAVCVEVMPSELIYDIKSRNDSAFIYITEYSAKSRIELADAMQNELGIGFIESEERARDLCTKSSLSDAERVKLIEYFIASADIYSATLQYRYIMDSANLQQLHLSDRVLKKLQVYSISNNEISTIAIPLCINNNIQRLENIDNLQDEPLLMKYFPSFMLDFTANQEKFKNIGNAPVFQRTSDLVNSCVEKGDLLDLFLFMNSEEFTKQDFEAQHAIWFYSDFDSGTDRSRYSLWEMRNLQITANILKVCAFYPSKRIIVIIGASHKGFIEKYLGQIPDIELLELK